MIMNDVINGDYNYLGEIRRVKYERQCEEAKSSSTRTGQKGVGLKLIDEQRI